jgi:hypothetical protein
MPELEPEEITVVSVTEVGSDHWVVEFSHPVWVGVAPFPPQRRRFWAPREDSSYKHMRTDALGAYMWGLKVIERNKKMGKDDEPQRT